MKKQTMVMLITLLFALIFAGAVSAENYTVGYGSGYNYNTISGAVSAAADGDDITVYSNNGNPYTENVNIAHNLTIKASGNVTVTPSNPSQNIFSISSGGSGSTIQGFTLIGPDTTSGISISSANNVKIINNTIINCTNGVYVYQSSSNKISGNRITYTGSAYAYGIYVDGSSNEFSGNTITLNGIGAGDSRGIHTWGDSHNISGNTITVTSSGTGGSYGINLNFNNIIGSGHNIEISGNTLYTSATTGNSVVLDFGSTFSDQAFGNNILGGEIQNGGTDNHLNFNRIVGDSTILSIGSVTLDALYNWYGSNANPSSRISTVLGSIVNYNPWLVLNVTASPTTVYNNGTSTIRADFTHDSAGGVHDPASGHLPDGIPVTFITTLGNIGSQSSTVNGIAQSTLKGGVAGEADVSAELDSGTVNTLVTVIDTVKPTAKANIKGGLYNANKAITLSMSEPGKIYYTKNGTNPTKTSTEYKSPISITSTTILKFIAIDLSGNPSSVYTEKYIIDKTSPKLISTYPKSGAKKVSRTKTIYIRFSENIKSSINWSKIYIKNRYGKKIKITKKWISGNKLYLKTKKRSRYSYYTVYIPASAVRDYAGNRLAKKYTFKFKTKK